MAIAVAGVARRRQACGERLVRAFAEARPELTHTLALMLSSADDAQDAVQDTFLKCWRTRERIDRVTNLRAWIFRVGLNTARDLQRNAWRRRSRPLSPFLAPSDRPGTSPPEQLLNHEALDRLRTA